MAGTVTITTENPLVGKVQRIIATCVADASAATFPATVLPAFDGKLLTLETNPGSPAPTDNYDITLVDQDGVDRLQGVGMNRDTANSEQVDIVFTGTSDNPAVDIGETLTLTIANNAVNSAQLVIEITYLAAD